MDGTTNDKVATFDDLVSIAATGKRRFTTTNPLPVCGLTFRIRSLFEKELSDYQAVVQAANPGEQRQQRMAAANRQFIALCLVDELGNTIVPVKQVGRLTDLDGADSQYLYDACVAHSGVNKQDLADLVKNSEANPEPQSDSPTS